MPSRRWKNSWLDKRCNLGRYARMTISWQQKLFNLNARFVQKPMLALVRPHWLMRKVADVNAFFMVKRPRGLRRQDVTLQAGGAKVAASWLDLGGDTSGGTILFLHGGAFVIGTIRGYAHIVSRLADGTGMAGLFVHYRMAPEYPFPAASDDALTAYRAVLDQGHDPARIALVGDSAGGNLVFSLLHRIGALGLPMPGAAAVMSPIVDLTLSSPSFQTNRRTEMLVAESWGRRGVRDYLHGADPTDPMASPINGRFAGAPPVMFQVVTTEALYNETTRMAVKLRADGVSVRVDEWHDVPHVWHLNAGRSPEANKGVADLADFIRDTIPDTNPGTVVSGPRGG